MKDLARIVLLLALLPVIGTLGFMGVEGWGFLDALYMSMITLTTVGYREVHPLSRPGQVFVMLYLVLGLGVFLFGVVRLGEMVVRAELRTWLGRRHMSEQLKSIQGHVIVCGFGRMGRSLCRQLVAQDLSVVVVERDAAAAAACRDEGLVCVQGDATDDTNLLAAGIARASSLAAVLSSDADNLYVILSARLLAPQLRIITRADDEKSVVKMQKAGANRVISLYETSAVKMAQLLASPNLEDFIEVFTSHGRALDLAELRLGADSPYVGRTLAQTDLRQKGLLVVGVRRASGELILPPPAETQLRPDDELIVIGTADAVTTVLGPRSRR
ncbi:MAG: potassium channel protein [Pirellulales bacterium]|nr:potassium channel protein [Pirellulales bacterium]